MQSLYFALILAFAHSNYSKKKLNFHLSILTSMFISALLNGAESYRIEEPQYHRINKRGLSSF
jgi:hypothetical protein